MLLLAYSSIEAWRQPVRSRESGPILRSDRLVQHIILNPRAEAWPLESYTRTWFRCLVALELLSVLIYILAFLTALSRFKVADLGNEIIGILMWNNGYAVPIINVGVMIFYATLFTCLETVRFRGTWHKVLMEIMPTVLVAAWCAGQICCMFLW